MCRNRNDIWTLAGVVSWGLGTAELQCMSTGVFARVSNYLDWIQIYRDTDYTPPGILESISIERFDFHVK